MHMTHKVSGHALVTKSARETKELAAALAKEALLLHRKGAVVFALQGELGSGKTTFTQGFARALGIKERILSPTFVLMKIYQIPQAQAKRFRHFVHVDAYRIGSKDLRHLGFEQFIKDEDAIVTVEWADRIKKLLPPEAVRIRFRHGENPRERKIQFL